MNRPLGGNFTYGGTPAKSVGIVMPVGDAGLDFFKIAFYSVCSFTEYPFAFTVVANNVDSHTRRFLRAAATNNGVGVVEYTEANRAASINLGLRHLFNRKGIEFGCVLPPDVVAEPYWLSTLVETISDSPGRGIVAPRSSGGSIHQASPKTRWELTDAPYVRDCFLFKKDTYLAVDGFDEILHGGFEDMDFCMKARARGDHILVDPFYLHRFLDADSGVFADTDDIALSEAIFQKRYPQARAAATLPGATKNKG